MVSRKSHLLVEVDDFRVSLAGAQEKTALLWYENQWQLPLGTTPTSHILKLPIGLIHYNQIDLAESARNEWLCLRLCQAFGLSVPNAQLVQVEDLSVLAVERFDRRWSSDQSWLMRLPQEDMCQALGYSPALKYEAEGGPSIAAIMRLLLGSQQASEDRSLFLRAQMVYWLLAASDGHAKNFSIFLEAGNRYRLTPFYDVLSLYPLMGKGIAPQKVRMAMALQGKNRHYHWSKIMPRHFISTAEYCGFSNEIVQSLLEKILTHAEKVVMTVADELDADFPAHISEPIFSGILNLAQRYRD
ncbi:HipA domain-containing protein [Thiofilum flexile]|uniref:HipA domain-containing protein n=1 Tax=Thiofilum flexile TaxID=125627 RepID=UPI00038137B7|nr:HipA domain-containing protein [Thiofilum flexile]